MKKLILLFILIMCLFVGLQAQTQTFSEDQCVNGTAYASGAYFVPTTTADKAFDNDLSTFWAAITGGSSTNRFWIAYKFTARKKVTKIRIHTRDGFESSSLSNFSIQGSNTSTNGEDGNWTTIMSGQNVTPVYDWSEFVFENHVSYSWYRLLDNNGVAYTTEHSVSIGEIEMMGNLTDGSNYDMLAHAELLSHIPSWSSADGAYSNVGATPDETGSPDCGDPQHNVWFKFQATSTEVDLKIRMSGVKGTLGYPVLTLFDEAGTVLGCNRNGITSFIQNTSLTVGSWYYFYIDNYAGDPGTFTVELSNQIGYDLKAKAQVLTHTSSWVSPDAAYSNVGATPDGTGTQECGDPQHNVWFKFQATSNEVDLKIRMTGAKGSLSYPILTLFDEAGTAIGCNRNGATTFIQNMTLNVGSWYYFYVDNYAGDPGTFTVELSNQINYDLKAKAVVLPHTSSWISPDAAYNNIDTTPDGTGSPTCGDPQHNVWFKFQATSTEVDLKIRMTGVKGSLNYPVLTLFDEAGTVIACNRNGVTSFIQNTSLTVGSWYYFYVDNYAGDPGTFTVELSNQINYDLRAKAEVLPHTSSWISPDAAYNNIDTTPDGTGSPTCGDPQRNVWFKFQATSTEVDLKIRMTGVKGSLNYPVLTLFDEAGTVLGCNRNGITSFIQNTTLTVGSWYYFYVDNYAGDPGTFTVELSNQISYDLKAKAEVVPHTGSWVSSDAAYSNDDTTPDGTGSPECSEPQHNVWFKFQATSNEVDIKLRTGGVKGTLFYHVLTLVDEAGTALACNRDQGTSYIQYKSLTVGNWYYFSVDNYAGDLGTFSLEVSDSDIMVPGGLAATATSPSDINLTWTDNSDNETGFQIERSLTTGSGFALVTTTASNITSYTDSNLTAATAYFYRVRAINDGSNSHYSSEATATTLLSAPLAPFSLKAVAETSTSVNLSWSDGSNNETGFEIERSLTSGSGYALIYTAPANTLSFINSSLTPKTTYYFRVRAINTAGSSPYATEVSIATPDSPPQPPTDLRAEVNSATSIVLNWSDKSNNETGVQVERSLSPDAGFSLIATTEANAITYIDNGLTAGNTYYYRIRAINGGGNTIYTPVANATLFVEGVAQLCANLYCDSNSGGIGIGTQVVPAGYKLAVKGKVMAEGVKVALQSEWPDYVFDKDHRLIDISALKKYIAENGHLPNMPAAKTVQQEGIDMSEINVLLLEKIEELSLYLIQMEERMSKLEAENKDLKRKK